MFIGIKPEEKEAIPGLHSPEYQFDDTVLAGAYRRICQYCDSRLYGGTERKLKKEQERYQNGKAGLCRPKKYKL